MQLLDNLKKVNDNIAAVRAKCGIGYDVALVAVTKTHPAQVVGEAVRAGLTQIGENRVQEAEGKFAALPGLVFTRHLIGHLQTNKANKAVEIFDWVQSVDSLELAGKLDRKASLLGKRLRVLIEVKTSDEAAKTGIAPELAGELAARVAGMQALELRGLMTVAPFTGVEADVRGAFSRLKRLFDDLVSAKLAPGFDTLSMGMSDDYLWAVEEGATMVRLGRTLFGERG